MVRPFLNRKIEKIPEVRFFKPRGIPLCNLDESILTEDQLEAIRLVDLEGLYHEEASKKMGVSRPTFGIILEQGRKALADAIINGKAIKIESGPVKCVKNKKNNICGRRRRRWRKNFDK